MSICGIAIHFVDPFATVARLLRSRIGDVARPLRFYLGRFAAEANEIVFVQEYSFET